MSNWQRLAAMLVMNAVIAALSGGLVAWRMVRRAMVLTQPTLGETHLKHLKFFVVSHQKSEFDVEWMRSEADAAVPDLVWRVPQVAFEVTDLSSELAGHKS